MDKILLSDTPCFNEKLPVWNYKFKFLESFNAIKFQVFFRNFVFRYEYIYEQKV